MISINPFSAPKLRAIGLACLFTTLTTNVRPLFAAAPRVFGNSSPSGSIYVRPGGTSFTWSYGNDVNTFAYYNVPSFSWMLTRGHFEYSTNSGGSWTTYTVVNDNQSPTYLAVTGKIWRFVDTTPADTTTNNSVGSAWTLFSAPSGTTSTGANITVDNAPTDITSNTYGVFIDAAVASTVATLTPTDTGDTIGGYWVLESQSVANLFTLTFDNTTGNTATLKLGSGTMPALGATPTVTVRYHDTYQTDTAGAPVSGQGFAKTLTFTVVQDSTTDLAGFGSEFSVNTTTALAQNAPAIACLSNGNYVVVWRSVGQGSDTSSTGGIYARIFNSTGTAQTGELQISPTDAVNQLSPSVAPLSNGRFVVAYTDASNANDIVYRVVAADGTPGTALTAHASTTGAQSAPRAAALLDGNFALVWVNPNNSNDISARVFDGTTGAALAAEFTVNSTTTGAQSIPDVAPLDGGNFIVVWRTDANGGDIAARTANLNGSVSAEFTIVGTATNQTAPRVAGYSDGKFVVTWTDPGLDGDSSSENNIYFQRYTAAGTTAGAATRANANTFANQTSSTITAFNDGGFLVAWTSTIQDADANGIYGRRFNGGGTAVDAVDVQINERRHYSQTAPAVAANTNGAFAATWVDSAQESSGTTNNGVEARVFNPAATPIVTTATQSNIATTSATLGGDVTSAGSATVTDRGIVWATTATPTTANNKVSIGTGTGAFSQSVTGLPASTTLYVRAFAISTAGTAYGSQISFTTLTADTTPPTVASIARQTPSGQSLTAGTTTATFRVTFSEAVNTPAIANFAVVAVNSSTIVGSIASVTPVSTSTYDVAVTVASGSGEFRLKVLD